MFVAFSVCDVLTWSELCGSSNELLLIHWTKLEQLGADFALFAHVNEEAS